MTRSQRDPTAAHFQHDSNYRVSIAAAYLGGDPGSNAWDAFAQIGKGVGMEVATGIELQPLPDGSVLIRLQNNDLGTINEQVVTQEVAEALPFLVRLLRAHYTIKEEKYVQK